LAVTQQGQLALAYENPTPPPRRTGPRRPIFYILPPRKISKRHVARFLILSALLHALFILLFGAPSGGSREGRAMWGSLQVDLRGPPVEAVPKLKLDTTLPIIPEKPAVSVSRAKPITRAQPVAPPQPPIQREPVIQPYSFPPLLDRLITPELKIDRAPLLKVPLPTPIQVPPTPAPEPPKAEVPAPPPVEIPLPAPPAPVPPPVIERAPLAAPIIPAVPAPPVQAPIVPAIPAPPVAPPIQAAPIEAPPIPVVTPPVEAAPLQIPVAPNAPTALERALEREPPPRIEPPAQVEPRAPAPKSEPALRPSPFTSPAPSPGVGKRADEPSSSYDPTAPSVDLDSVRKRAGELAREGAGRRAVLPFPMPPVPDRKTKMEDAIEKARKPDCKTAYQGLGLIAVIPLIANEFGEGNCRW
jgi:hypothetical protein